MENAVGLGQVAVAGADVYWNESRPSEGGRLVVVRRAPDGTVEDVVGPGYSARTRVHEYGGVSYLVRDRIVWFTNFVDQRIYRVEDGADRGTGHARTARACEASDSPTSRSLRTRGG